jgi:hypothetical protein
MDDDLFVGNAGDWGAGFADRVLLASSVAGFALGGAPREMLAGGTPADARACDIGYRTACGSKRVPLRITQF